MDGWDMEKVMSVLYVHLTRSRPIVQPQDTSVNPLSSFYYTGHGDPIFT